MEVVRWWVGGLYNHSKSNWIATRPSWRTEYPEAKYFVVKWMTIRVE
jgi:hypothetical protein